jgi:cholera toxin transcriptional activator
MRLVPGRIEVAEAKRENAIFRFGVFELDAQSGELRKEGKALPRIRDQALRILLMLLERPRDVVTREELRERLWASDTFVDFDHGVNTAINQLRNALGDSPASPRFIQTLPRRGYRFIAPVEVAVDAASTGSADRNRQQASPGSSRLNNGVECNSSDARPLVLSDPQDLPSVSRNIMRFLFSGIQVMYLAFYIVSLVRLSDVHAILTESGDPILPILVLLIITAAAGIPIRLYLLSATAFNYQRLHLKFLKLFPFLLPLDELWALAPFLTVQQIGVGAAIAATAALLYVPFAQRSLLLMGSASRRA